MIKIYCKDCRNICKPSGAWYEPHPESICKNKLMINFVTRELSYPQCKNINTNGKCKNFKEKKR